MRWITKIMQENNEKWNSWRELEFKSRREEEEIVKLRFKTEREKIEIMKLEEQNQNNEKKTTAMSKEEK